MRNKSQLTILSPDSVNLEYIIDEASSVYTIFFLTRLSILIVRLLEKSAKKWTGAANFNDKI